LAQGLTSGFTIRPTDHFPAVDCSQSLGAMAKLSSGDIVLVACMSYVLFDLLLDWERLSGCSKPMNLWLLVSYALMIISRASYVIGVLNRPTNSESFLLCARQPGKVPQVLFWLTWTVIVPAFAFWSLLGYFWLSDVRAQTPMCWPEASDFWFLVTWQVLCVVWVALHLGLAGVAIVVERNLRRSESQLRLVEDADALSRWGQVSSLAIAEGPVAPQCLEGLEAAQVLALPGLSSIGPLSLDARCGEDCPICLCELREGDAARSLCGCGHTFHKSCIDLWLVRCANCPLCKAEVGNHSGREIFKV